jgi:hypothetical protein
LDGMAISGLSMAGHTRAVTDMAEAGRIMRKYPEQTSLPGPEEVRIFRVTPTVISVFEYSKGFGHADPVSDPGDWEMASTSSMRPMRSPSQTVPPGVDAIGHSIGR